MALTYTWKVTGLKKRDQVNSEGETLAGAIVQTYWECKGTDENGNVGTFSGATPFTAVDVPAGSFVAFESLTEEAVLSWIKAVVENDPTYKAHIDERIVDQIDASNTVDATMPWAEEEVTPTPDPALDPEVAAEPDADPEEEPV